MEENSNQESFFFTRIEIKNLLKIPDNLAQASLDTPYIHNRLNVILLELGKKLNRLTRKKEKVYKQKFEYYTGKAHPDVYKENPFNLKILKTDIHIYLSSDDELSSLCEEIEDLKVDIKFIEESLKCCNQRTFQIKEAIEYNKFINGEC